MKKNLLFIFCLFLAQAAFSQNKTIISEVNDFKSLLSQEQKKIAELPFSDSSRLKWSNLPMEETTRQGIQFKDLSDEQKIKVHRILRNVLSQQGYQKILFIMQYDEELHLRMVTANNPLARKYGQNNYWITVFGEPQKNNSWGLKFEGHHISINLTFSSEGEVISCTPLFTGVNPAFSATGLFAGKYILADENELGKELYASLTPDLQKKAFIGELPKDADTRMELNKAVKAGTWTVEKNIKTIPSSHMGVSFTEMNNAQQVLVKRIIHSWVDNFNEKIATAQSQKINKNLNKINFSWMGTSDVEQLHYYRLQSPDFIIEFTNRDQGQYHFHSLWRE